MTKLKRFKKEEDKKRISIKIASAFMIAGTLLVGISYAVYQNEDEVTFINARVGEFKENDIQLAIKVNGEQVDNIPTIEEKDNYTVTVNCDYADGVWNTELWGATITNIHANKVKCEVNFTTPTPTLSELTASSEKTSISLSYISSGIGTSTTCVYGKDTNYGNNASNVTNSECSLTGLDADTTYYYKVCATNAKGEVCKEGNTKTKVLTLADKVEIGDYVSMIPTSTSYILPNSLSGCTGASSTCIQNTINPSELNLWRVIKKNDDGTVDAVSEYVSSKNVYFYGKAGYMNLVGGLNAVAAQYTNDKYVSKTRHIGYSNQIEKCTTLSSTACPADSGYKIDTDLIKTSIGTLVGKTTRETATAYWLASRGAHSSYYYNRGMDTSGNTFSYYLISSDGDQRSYQYAIRPIVTFKSTIELVSGDGKSASTAYKFE